MRTRIIVFFSKDDCDAGARRAHILAEELKHAGRSPKLVDKLGFDIGDLHLVARYRVVSTPCVLILDSDSVAYRKLGVPQAADICEIQDLLESS
jgi:hypothetical protein